MATEAQINANRENAQKSTGPVTAEGKAAVSQNALKHGLFAVRDVVPTENQQDFDSMQEQMLADLAPVGAMESLLAQRAVSLAWRLKRAETMQAQIFEDMVESRISDVQWRLGRKKPTEPRYAPEYLVIGRVAKDDWSGRRLIERLFEYERRIEKSLYKTMAELRATQLIRQTAQAEAAKPPAALPGGQTNSEKQSQFSETESIPETVADRLKQWPDSYGIDPKELTAFLRKTYGDGYPGMVKVILNRHNGSATRPQAAFQSQAHPGGNGEHLPLSAAMR